MKESKEKSSGYSWILKNILGAIAFFLAIALVAHFSLGIFTRHSSVIEVPDMTNMSIEEATALADAAGIRVDVTDSVYVRRMAKGAVFRQNPAAGSHVKPGRRIMLTINSFIPKKVTMPNLIGLTMRQAKAELSSKGLSLGRLNYVEDIATNNVLEQLLHGREIEPGESVESGSNIDLTLGLDSMDDMASVPFVVGQKYVRAMDAIHDNSLNVGRTAFDSSVKNYNDSLNAVVYRQYPEPDLMAPVLMGSEVSIYLTVDPQRMPSNNN